MPYCTACGAAVRTTDAFCPECGTKRHEPDGEVSMPSTDERADQRAAEPGGSAADERPGETAEPAEEASPFERDSFSFGLSYPVSDGYEPFLLGSIFALVGSMIPFVGLFTNGYAFQLAGAAASGRPDPPGFDAFVDLFVDGLRATVALLVLWGGTAIVGAAVAAVAEQVGLAGGVRDLAVALVAFAGLYLTPAVLTAYAATGRFPRAFSGRYTGAFATSKEYLEAFAAWVLLLVMATVLWLASILTLVGPAFVATYASYAFAAFWGYHYREAANAGVVPPLAADDEREQAAIGPTNQSP
ncbi:DUF4013 domain-containing protein [Haloarcula pellucida]|uniref:Zinc-ribbon domain-containing protein n=1 Tax=Haloarcula pellucida TaxID=1427151 RepID=A0A830GPF8_9EURY|nr:DUF4013 domain-containing protein [Halomicroarcula pellucida]MBX0349214.1 DUF4013 domain-containing protein [Halomicroarcula pellucida]GGN99547.1 hypothetical protein GCM10009030_31210 [Halomicroarcula pellucida]